MKKESAITLISLVVTIIILLILVEVTISALNGEDGILTNAKKAEFISELTNINEELSLYNSEISIKTNGSYQKEKLNGDMTYIKYSGEDNIFNGESNISDILPSLKNSEHANDFVVISGRLVFNGSDERSLKWAKAAGIDISIFTIVDGELLSTNASISFIDESGILTIPSNVTKISSGAFHNVQGLKKLVIPGTVKEIGANVFSNNQTLESVTIGEGVERIGEFAFSNCISLKEVYIPDSVTFIGNTCFGNCINLTNIRISENLEVIQYRMLSGCNNLEQINIPNSVKQIEGSAFENCIKIKSINISKYVETIGGGIITGDISLDNINVDSKSQYFLSEGGVLYNKDRTILYFGLPNIISVNLPNTLIQIQSQAFYDSTKLTTINIPEKVNYIGPSALYNISNVSIDPSNATYSCNNNVIYSKDMKRLILYLNQASEYTIPNSVEYIQVKAFYKKYNNISKIIMPVGLVEIEDFAFVGCYNLKEIEFFENLKILRASSFRGSGISKVTISEANPYFTVRENFVLSKDGKTLVAAIKNDSKSIYIPEGIETLKISSFYDIDNVESIILPSTIKTIENDVFDNCSSLKKVEIPSSIEQIANTAFTRCTSLSQIIIHKPKNSIKGSPWSNPFGERSIIWDE